ncbi:MAG TPA: exosortase J [Edaphobacter sp.]|nr:exosortase J [Edaphobacter sp.]
MSTLPAADVRSRPMLHVASLTPKLTAGLATVFAVLGLCSIWSTVGLLWQLWTMDALKSIGMMIPLVSAVLILRVWRSQQWQMQGSLWGLVILTVTIAAVHIRDQAILVFVVSPQWAVYFPPHSLVAFAYVSGVVLLFGGTRLYRAALFPIILIWFVNPIPHIFNVYVDLPLQRVSAHVARSFAIALGQPLSHDQLSLMFTPNFGMFIAPGCNGIRGAVTMGFIALIAGYVYRFRLYAHVAVISGAILLGYLFNFVRLCLLVLYYIVALHIAWLQHHGEMADYIIGGCLFLSATVFLFTIIHRLSETPGRIKPPALNQSSSAFTSPNFLRVRMTAMALIALFGCYGFAHALASTRAAAAAVHAQRDLTNPGQFPAHIGNYKLSRSWDEHLFTGALLYHWADYAPTGGGTHIVLGIAPLLGSHDTLICHSARGDEPLWHDQLTIPTATGKPIGFSAAFFADSAIQYLEATTVCNGSNCGEYSSPRTHFGFVYSKPDPQSLLTQNPLRPIPILFRAETTDTTLPADEARKQLSTSISTFIASVNLDALTRPYRRP